MTDLSIPPFLNRSKTEKLAGSEPKSNIPSAPQDPKKAPKPKTPQVAPLAGMTPLGVKAKSELKDKQGRDLIGKARKVARQKAEAKTDAKPSGKAEIIVRMLSRKNGASAAEVRAELDWPAINLKGHSKDYAKRFGYKASQNKDSGVTRYFLTRA